jgi:hypothetical protein|tara:strand:- start:1050 stop:1754 length:705 start_codon:yes stop_codon:yes gene_type:complete
MRKIYLIYILIFSLSCSKGQTENRISEFENILGKKESNTLTYLVEDFEKNYLNKLYPNLNTNDAYEKLLTKINNSGKTPDPREFLKEGYKKYEKSKLKLQIYSLPDSIWIEKDINKTIFKGFDPTLKIKWKSLTNKGIYEYRTSESSVNHMKNMSEDEIIKKAENRVSINYFGSYNKAINAVFNEPSFINEYFEIRDNSGNSNPSIFINRLLNSNSDFNDYFIKRITVIELVYW